MIKEIHNSIIQTLSKGPLPVSDIVLLLVNDYTPGAIHEAIYTLATESIVEFPDHQDSGQRGLILDAARTLLEKTGFISKKQPWIELSPEPSTEELLARITPDPIPRMWQLTDRGRQKLQIQEIEICEAQMDIEANRQDQIRLQNQVPFKDKSPDQDPERFDGLS